MNKYKLKIGDNATFSKHASKVWWNCEVLELLPNEEYKVKTENGEEKIFKQSHYLENPIKAKPRIQNRADVK